MEVIITAAKIFVSLVGGGRLAFEIVRRLFPNFLRKNNSDMIENGEKSLENEWLLVNQCNDNPIQYCNGIDSVEVNDETVNEIIGYVLEFQRKSFENNYDEFSYYCAKITNILGSSEPYSKSMKINVTEKLTNIGELIACLPIDGLALKEMIELAIVKLESIGITPTKSQTINSEFTDFFTVIVSGSGDNILVSPCYMRIARECVCEKTLVSEERSFYYRAEYVSQTFTLSKFAIEIISQNIKARKICDYGENMSTNSSGAECSKVVEN